jgi:hypothetical protein
MSDRPVVVFGDEKKLEKVSQVDDHELLRSPREPINHCSWLLIHIAHFG